jgi:hypothetical protein
MVKKPFTGSPWLKPAYIAVGESFGRVVPAKIPRRV